MPTRVETALRMNSLLPEGDHGVLVPVKPCKVKIFGDTEIPDLRDSIIFSGANYYESDFTVKGDLTASRRLSILVTTVADSSSMRFTFS